MNDMSARGLPALRAEIDAIDDEILRLIEQRMTIADAVAAMKDEEGDDRLKLRPRRQKEVIARLARRAANVPGALIGAVWRELMGHGLQAQARTEIILCGAIDRAVLEAYVRNLFGMAFPISWASSDTEALRRARDEEAIAVIAGPLPQLDRRLAICDLVRAPDGSAVAYAIGRVAAADCAETVGEAGAAPPLRGPSAAAWSPSSWRLRKAEQLPAYPDAGALSRVERRLEASAPAGLRRRHPAAPRQARRGGGGRGLPPPGRRLRRDLRRVRRRQGAAQLQPAAADGGDDPHRRRRRGGQGRAHGRPVRQAALGAGRDDRRGHPPHLSRRHRQRPRLRPRRAAPPIRCGCSRRTASPRSRSTCSRPIRPRPMPTFPRSTAPRGAGSASASTCDAAGRYRPAGRDVHQPRGAAAQLRAGADPLGRG